MVYVEEEAVAPMKVEEAEEDQQEDHFLGLMVVSKVQPLLHFENPYRRFKKSFKVLFL